jgi:hypothetical protein
MRPKGRCPLSKRTLGDPRQSGAPLGAASRPSAVSRAAGVADSLDKAKAAFRAAWERPLSAAAFAASYAQMQTDRPARDK